MTKRVCRRDLCYIVGIRAARLNPMEAATAWSLLAGQLEELGDEELPKFKHLISAIRTATIQAKRKASL